MSTLNKLSTLKQCEETCLYILHRGRELHGKVGYGATYPDVYVIYGQ